MNATSYPVPSPPDRCALGHGYQADECTACEDLAAWHEAFNAWCESDEALRWLEMDEAEASLVAEGETTRALLLNGVEHGHLCPCNRCEERYAQRIPASVRLHDAYAFGDVPPTSRRNRERAE